MEKLTPHPPNDDDDDDPFVDSFRVKVVPFPLLCIKSLFDVFSWVM